MLIKAKDDPAQAIAQLEHLLQQADLSDDQRRWVEGELARLRQGWRGEKDVAYFLDFEFRHDPYWAVIHDLRIRVQNRVAQIDHLLFNRWLEAYVLESKAFREGLKITANGQFLFWDGRARKYRAIASPVAQVGRHERVLKDLLRTEVWPRWNGSTFSLPRFFALVLVSPRSRLMIEDGVPSDLRRRVYLADQFVEMLRKYTQKLLRQERKGRPAPLTSEQLRALAEAVVAYHRPQQVDYAARLGLRRGGRQRRLAEPAPRYQAGSKATPAPAKTVSRRTKTAQDGSTAAAERDYYFCARCKKRISRRVALFCFQHKERFGGRAYCLACQKHFPEPGS